MTCQALVLISKGGEDYRGIGLVEVMCKAVAVILNHCFTESTTYHDSLNGFQVGLSTGNATLEAKLLWQVMAMREVVLHAIFLDLHKAYDALDMSRCMDILEGYGVGYRYLCLLCRYWERLQMVARAADV